VVNPIGSYNVDVVHSRSAEVTAAYMSVSTILRDYQSGTHSFISGRAGRF
jgi:hypothetical protein